MHELPDKDQEKEVMSKRTSGVDQCNEPAELPGFRQITEQLIQNLSDNNPEAIFRCISDITHINNQSIFNIVGKITRELHNAIADLSIPAANHESTKNRTRAGLQYVIEVTDGAARTTLDMTDKARLSIAGLNANLDRQTALLQSFEVARDPGQLDGFLRDIGALTAANSGIVNAISGNITEITVTQNFQDLASQSISKAITIINDVESSLVSLVQYTNLLRQLSQYSSKSELLDAEATEELRSNLEQIDIGGESEHMDQNEVDNMLSSLGF